MRVVCADYTVKKLKDLIEMYSYDINLYSIMEKEKGVLNYAVSSLNPAAIIESLLDIFEKELKCLFSIMNECQSVRSKEATRIRNYVEKNDINTLPNIYRNYIYPIVEHNLNKII